MFMTPMPLKWRDTAIRGHRDRGAGILNNETYIGRLVFNCRNFRKNPETENREARMNDMSEWVVGEAPELRIVSDELWAKVKKRQLAVEASFSHTTTNRLNRAHRPQYLLSGLLECDHCCGPYAIMAKDRYGCTNRQKKLPIDDLGGIDLLPRGNQSPGSEGHGCERQGRGDDRGQTECDRLQTETDRRADDRTHACWPDEDCRL